MAPRKGSDAQNNPKKKHAAARTAQNRTPAGATRTEQGEVSSQTTPGLQISQNLLNVFVAAFPHLLGSSNVTQVLLPALQKIKGHLYNREFDAAFGSREYLEAYVTRWSPSRALCYVRAFGEAFKECLGDSDKTETLPRVENGIQNLSAGGDVSTSSRKPVHVTCLGGGAAELAGLAAVPHLLPREGVELVQVNLIDKADWSEPLDSLFKSLTNAAPSPTHDSESSLCGGKQPFIQATHLDLAFHQMDLLNSATSAINSLNEKLHNSNIVTLMFTLNELYSSSITSTQSMLLNITTTVTPGTLLLVVDSAGSYSTVTVNQKEKKYPMQWLLDYTLMNFAPKAVHDSITNEAPADADISDSFSGSPQKAKPERPLWELVMSTDSRWYRLPEVRYPVELENMRYQQHLYRRI